MTHLQNRRMRSPRPALRWLGIACGVWIGMGVASEASAASRGVSDGLTRVDEEVDSLEGRMNRLAREYGERRGLIGADEAVRRYEDAVYTYLIDDYERAAIAFFTLVESEALTTVALHQDSEWYLAECLFQMENWNTALAAYEEIIAEGATHPYLGEAVRRTLEIYGILRDNDRFYSVYRKYVLSGVVPASDGVKYTVAKSFYRQGEWGRAKAMFTELPAKSRWYAQARYFTGTILAAEGEFEAALNEFRRVEQVKGGDSRLAELVFLAIGRIQYELGNYTAAVESYQRVPSSSPYFADQLYEITWTYIKQAAWQEAIDSVEIFTVAFPEHPYTVRMRLVEGHLHRKSAQFERALATYESVVEEYSPVRAQLLSLENDRQSPFDFFERLVNDETLDVSGVLLPSYATELLVEHEGLRRAVAVRQELVQQAGTLETSEAVIADVASVLRSPSESVGSFVRGRAGLQRVHDDSLAIRIRLLELELDHLESGASSSLKKVVEEKRGALELIVGDAQEAQGQAAAQSNRYQAYVDQVATVQAEATRLASIVTSTRGELAALERQFRDRTGGMTADARDFVDSQLSGARDTLQSAESALASVTSDARRRVLLSVAPGAGSPSGGAPAGDIAAALDALHRDLRGMRAQASSSDMETFSNIDQKWVRVHDADARATATTGLLEQVEAREVAVLKRTLDAQEDTVARLGGEVASVTAGTQGLAAEITRASLL